MTTEKPIHYRRHMLGLPLSVCTTALLLVCLVGCRSTNKAQLPAEAELGVEAIAEAEGAATTATDPVTVPEDMPATPSATPTAVAPAAAAAPTPLEPAPQPAIATVAPTPVQPATPAEPVVTDEALAPPVEANIDESPAETKQRSPYMSDRGADFLDIFGIRIGGGGTVYGRLRLTKFGMLGAGFFKGRWCGTHGRAAGLWREKRIEGGVSVLYETEYDRSEMRGNSFVQNEMFLPTSSRKPRKNGLLPIDKRTWELQDDDYHWGDFGIGIGLLAVAAEVHVSPFELADFLLGIYGADVADDDTRNRPAGR